ncbi:hypothetical protein M406DRAFT_73234 [Cryphonectria parasitica EP155]|uniref:Uncharacterized protein n=1 Tax=Cryphonectria parasitica (strain ATCC 38755 / EP155) TaxID=660469 RepID=A0A9P5CJ29_CRYP1|nr:uncharacterized protein M406DRAFT_73234 [Cryphonectria parasitica EP155]KAF3760773.1 hypothetical protein M406DRAFT_73234 [Cryphonectria parasitica EP155]
MYKRPAYEELGVRPVHRQDGSIDLRARIKAYAGDEEGNEPECLSPTEAFFARPTHHAKPVQQQTRQAPVARAQQKHRLPQREPERPQKRLWLQMKQPSLDNLRHVESPLDQELIDHVVANRDTLYNDALASLTDLHAELQQDLMRTISEDERVLALLDNNHKKITKQLSDTRINDPEAGHVVRVGDRIASFVKYIDTVEVELTSLWAQREVAQKEVDDIFAELANTQDAAECEQASAVMAVKKSFANEIDKVSNELSSILDNAHEEARVSEKNFSKKIKGVMSGLLQQYLLED